jgi:hypothetical protein
METNANSNWTRIKKKIHKIFFWLVGVLFVVMAIIVYWKYFYTYSDGYRAGLLQKVSHKGFVFKTYEGEMVLSSVTSNTNTAIASEKFYFSVTDKKLASMLDTIQGQYVIVHYYQKNGILFWRGDSEYQVDEVKRK